MITASFKHIRGLGGLRERQLWRAGIRSWDDVPPEGPILAPALDERLRAGVAESRARLAAGDLDHFARALAPTEHWRLLPQLGAAAAFLDVESSRDGVPAVVGVIDAAGVRAFVGGAIERELLARAAKWRCVVTFNGASFDLPVLRRAFPRWEPPAAHVDLRHVYARLGERCGLKELEERVGLGRPAHLKALGGAQAVGLWDARVAGDPRALRLLVEYNLYDVLSLRPLAELGYNRLVARSGMPAPPLAVTERGALLYDVSRAVEAACG